MHKVQRWTPRMEASISRMDRRTSHRELSMLQVEAPMPRSEVFASLSDQCRWLMGLSVGTFDVRVALPGFMSFRVEWASKERREVRANG